jgi:hypothetical protein
MLTESFPFNYMLKSKFSLSRHFEYANEQITYHFWLCLFLRNSRRKSGVGKMNGTAITNRLQNSFKIKDNNVYRSSYYWNFRTSSFKQVACLVLKDEVLLTVGCPIFPSILIAKYLFTGSLRNRSIDNLETQKKYISMKNSQFFNHLLYAKSK